MCYTLLLFKKFSSEKRILTGLGPEPTSPCSWEEIAGALNHSATTTCWEIELNNRIYIDLKFLILRLKIILRLVSSRQSGWIILYLESTSKSVCTCYRKHQPQMKHCPEESVSPIKAMGCMPDVPKKIFGNFKWVFIKRRQSSCSRLWDLQIPLGIQYRTLSPWGWDTLVLTLFSTWYIILSFWYWGP